MVLLIHETDDNNNQTILTIPSTEKTFVIVINSMILLNTLAILDLDTFQVRISLKIQLRLINPSF